MLTASQLPSVMKKHKCDSIIITCMDFRFQELLDTWIDENFPEFSFDRIALGGACFDFYAVLKQVEISYNLHKIHKVVIVNHEECGAYGPAGTFKRHQHDLFEAERKIEELFPKLDVGVFYMKKTGEVKDLSRTNSRRKKSV